MGIDAIIALLGLVIPPGVDFIKKKFLKPGTDTPEATMSALATTNPGVLPDYVTAVTGLLKAQVEFFNRDVIGAPSQWVVNLRAAIRPIGTIGAALTLAGMVAASFMEFDIDPSVAGTIDGVRLTCELMLTSWFGSRISLSQ